MYDSLVTDIVLYARCGLWSYRIALGDTLFAS